MIWGVEGWVRTEGKWVRNVWVRNVRVKNSYVRLRRFEVEPGVSFSYLQHVTRQGLWVVQGGHHVFDGSHHYSGVTIASIYVGYYNASKFGEARF